MRNFLLLVPALAFAYPAAVRAETPPSFSIRSIHYSGPGCPQGSVATSIPRTLDTFTLLFSQLSAQAGPGVDMGMARRSCQLTLVLDFPSGWSFSIEGADVRGYGMLEEDMRGILRSTYSFPGAPREARAFELELAGEMDENFTKSDIVDPDLFSPCSGRRNLHVKTEIRVDDREARGRRGLVTVDSVDGVLRQTYRLRFRRC